MRCNWWRWLWGIIPLLVLSWVAVQAEHGRIEADLRGRARLVLVQAGMSWAATKFEGQTPPWMARPATTPSRCELEICCAACGVYASSTTTPSCLPKVDTFTWTARRRGNRIRIMGHVPNRATRMAIRGVARANFPGFEVVDRMATVRGVPSVDAWLGGVGFGLKQLAALKRGDVHLKNLDMWIAGEAEDVASYRVVKSALANNLPKGIKLTGDLVTAPLVSPFTWSAQLADGRLVLSGYVPNEAAQAELLAAAKASFGSMIVVDQMQPGDGAPKAWSSAAVASLNALARLQTGSVEMKDAALVVSGLAGDATAAEAMRAALRTGLPASIKLTDQIKAKEPPPPPPPAPEPAAPAAHCHPKAQRQPRQASRKRSGRCLPRARPTPRLTCPPQRLRRLRARSICAPRRARETSSQALARRSTALATCEGVVGGRWSRGVGLARRAGSAPTVSGLLWRGCLCAFGWQWSR